jgi:hypothetical protein
MAAVREYMVHGFNTARTVVDECLSFLWLDEHADFGEHLEVVQTLQKLENRVKTHFIATFQPEPKHHLLTREKILAERLWQSPIEDVRSRLRALRQHTNELYHEWKEEVEEDDVQSMTDTVDDYVSGFSVSELVS